MTLLASFQALLARYTGREDFAVGSPIAGRTRAETEGLIGFFVNMLVLRADLAGDPAFRAALAGVRGAALGAYAHQDVPFEKLVEELAPGRSLAHSPLFQVVFLLQNVAAPRELAGLRMSRIEGGGGISKFDLTLGFADGRTGDGLRGWIEYNTDLFDAATVERLAGHFEELLGGVAGAPGRRVSELPLLRAEERAQLLAGWNDTAAPYEREAGLPELFELQARRAPEAVALVSGVRRMTYGELEERANRLAHHLIDLGAGPEVPVVLFVERSFEAIVAILAVLKAGGAYVALDPEMPEERLAGMLGELFGDGSAPRIFFVQDHLAERLPEAVLAGATLVMPEREAVAIARRSDLAPGREASADQLAYVMYTSGSTGRPKAVGVSHRNVARLVRGSRFIEMGPEQVFLQLAPLSFDASTLEIWGALLHGARLVLFPAGRFALEDLGRELQASGVTALWLTAGLFHPMVDDHLESLRGVRQLLAGGDVLSPAHVNRVLAELPGTVLVNGYGPTENTTFTTCHAMAPGGRVDGAVPLGRPIANTRAYVLDRALEPVPAGVPGELFAGGDGVARGYLGRPELTAERFVPDPFRDPIAEPGARLYRTGDLVRWRPDGTLEFLGRVDNQVKIRGFRVEPGEVETVLQGHPGLVAACVVVREDLPGERRLVAYWVPAKAPDEKAVLSSAGLRGFLGERLPDYMIPAAFVRMAELPLNANGKVDRRALPAPDMDGGRETGFVAPRTEMEALLASVWSEVLGVERVGAEDDFFELGGHSLKAAQVVSRVRARLSAGVPLRVLFESPRLADLAAWLEQAERTAEPEAVAAVPGGRELPLSFAQERLWFLDQLEPGSAAYNVPLALRLEGDLDAAALEAALREIVRRHEVLRTTFAERKGSRSRSSRPSRACRSSASTSRRCRPPTASASCGRSASGRWPRRSTCAGARCCARCWCGWRAASTCCCSPCTTSSRTAGRWASCCGSWMRSTGLPGGTRPALPEPASGAADAVRRLRGLAARRAGGRGAGPARSTWWRNRLAGAPALLELPTDRPRPARQSFRGAALRSALSPELTARRSATLARRRGRDAVHGAAGGVPGAALALHRPGGRGGGHADRGPHPRRRPRG